MKKIVDIINRFFGITVLIEFLAGGLSIVGYIVAIFIGGELGTQISLFIFEKYLRWVIIATSITIGTGLISMYLNKQKALFFEKNKK